MQIKAFNDLILEIQNKEIKFGRFADEKITADMVKLMMTDIAYDIFYKNFDTVLDVKVPVEDVCEVKEGKKKVVTKKFLPQEVSFVEINPRLKDDIKALKKLLLPSSLLRNGSDQA